MKMKHLILEFYCDCDNSKVNKPCDICDGNIGVHCIKCKSLSYACCPHEIAYSNEDGVVETLDDFIGFGGEMDHDDLKERQELITVWDKICKAKISEAFEEYMNVRNRYKD